MLGKNLLSGVYAGQASFIMWQEIVPIILQKKYSFVLCQIKLLTLKSTRTVSASNNADIKHVNKFVNMFVLYVSAN